MVRKKYFAGGLLGTAVKAVYKANKDKIKSFAKDKLKGKLNTTKNLKEAVNIVKNKMLKGDKKYETGDSILNTQKLYGLMKGEKQLNKFLKKTQDKIKGTKDLKKLKSEGRKPSFKGGLIKKPKLAMRGY
tara:strand:+ start:42 stop:431 length:390 start_codon:yes stop_codon:yes gene_type:complete